jgi:uncharacterized protein (DUF302 family)
MPQIGYSHQTIQPFSTVADRVRAAVVAQGFSIVSEMNVQSTFQQKLGVACEPYLILGVCHPQTAHLVLTTDPELGHLLPCNVLVYQRGDVVFVSAVQPSMMMSLGHNASIEQAAKEMEEKLHHIVETATL